MRWWMGMIIGLPSSEIAKKVDFIITHVDVSLCFHSVRIINPLNHFFLKS